MIKEFLVDKIILLGFFGIFFLFVIIFLFMIDIPVLTIMTFALMVLFLLTSGLAMTFIVAKKRMATIEQLLKQLEAPYLAGEILPKPNSFVEQQYFDVVRMISKDAIEHVEKANQQAVEYQEFVEQWIHELKTPMTAMNLIVANGGDVRKLRKELKRLDNLTDQILHFARLQSIEKDKKFESISLAPVLNDVVKNQMDILIAARMQIAIDGEGTVYTDRKIVEFIINQLLINSAKYAPQSQIVMTIQNHTLVYEDKGIGMLKHELPRIFEKGYTGTNGRNLGTSTGMGLYIVATLCKELHIQIDVESEVSQFTRFTLTFPQI